MRELVNLNHILEQMRNQALESLTTGPRVFITGNSHSGKSTISKILVNYCVKLGWTPIYVDLDLI
jgi:polyribonucleotide 5'-hydroxyl-kinase